MDNNSDTDFIGVVVVFLIVACVIGVILAVYESGFKDGAMAVHRGEYTVTTLPDGSEVVTKARKD